jgi:lincosamide nucleotidyltransferase A/C/D/E
MSVSDDPERCAVSTVKPSWFVRTWETAGVVTEMTCEDVIEILAALDAGGIDYWVDGGWGIDALVGEQTRLHHDLDLGVSRDDVARIEALLPQFRRESEQASCESEQASFYTDERGRAVDLMLVERSQAGQFEQQLPEGGRLRYAESETHASGCIGGRVVRCATVALQREHRNRPNATDQDRTDVEVLERAGTSVGKPT